MLIPITITSANLSKWKCLTKVIKFQSTYPNCTWTAYVTFCLEDERIPAHRLILSSRNYFRALLSGHLLENQNEEICLKDVRATPFKALLKFIYNGYLVLSDMEMDEIIDILRLAQMYGFIDRTDSIESHLEHAISMETVWPILKVSQDLIIDSLSEACFKFLDRNASTVLLHDQLPTLSKVKLWH